jgi:multiple sugar transport system substrate-binding protein
MKLTRKSALALLASALLLLGSACGAGQGAGGTTAGGAEPPAATSETQPEAQPETQRETEPETQPASAEAAEAGLEIRFTWWGDTKRHEVYNAICDDFEANNPGIRVIREPAAFNDYRDKLVTQLAGGGAPDVMGVHTSFGSDFATRGVLEDMQPYIDSGVFETDQIPAAVLEGGRLNGALCMIAQGVTFDAMCVNQSLVEEVGADLGVDYVGGEQFTWESFANAHKIFREAALAAGKDCYFSSMPQDNLETYRYWTRTTEPGSDVYSAEGGVGSSRQTIAGWFSYNNDMRIADLLPDAATVIENRSVALEQNMFTLRRTAVMSIPANQLRLYSLQMPDANLVLVPYPSGNDGTQVNSIIASHLSVYALADEARRQAGMRFMNHFVNRESATNILQMEQGVPPNTKCAEALLSVLDEPSAKALEFVNATMGQNAKDFVYPPPGAAEFSVVFRDASDRVSYGEQTPDAAAEQLLGEAEALFGRQ